MLMRAVTLERTEPKPGRSFRFSIAWILLFGLLGAACRPERSASVARPEPRPLRSGGVSGQPYTFHEALDQLGRTVGFYLSEEQQGAELPLIVYIQGSGAHSHFVRVGAHVAGRTGHSSLA